MTSDMENPAQAGRGAPKYSHCWQALENSENTPNSLDIQDFRAAWLARRARISLSLAATLAPLALNVEGGR